jgi:hypothetical protein
MGSLLFGPRTEKRGSEYFCDPDGNPPSCSHSTPARLLNGSSTCWMERRPFSVFNCDSKLLTRARQYLEKDFSHKRANFAEKLT